MKIRIFRDMDDAVYRILVATEDWSQGDVELMERFGEPEVDVGGEIHYDHESEARSKTFGSEFVRVLHGFPYSRGFDSRDYGSYDEAVAVGIAWKDKVVQRLQAAVTELRTKAETLPTEEVTEI